MNAAVRDTDPDDLFIGASDVAHCMRTVDWANTPLGTPSTWPQSLKTVLHIMLTSRYPMWMAWGPELVFFYNDAYLPTLGEKHPGALGSSMREVWRELWPTIGTGIERVIELGEPFSEEAMPLFFDRGGYSEETYYTFSYSPVPDDTGAVAGILSIVTDDTEHIVEGRRIEFLRLLAVDLASAHTLDDVFATACERLAVNGQDLPFTLIYMFDESGTCAHLACSAGIHDDHPAAPAVLEIEDADAIWPVTGVAQSANAIKVSGLAERFADLPCGSWSIPPREGVIVPFDRPGQERPTGFFVVGLNPHRTFDTGYAGFVNLIAGQLSASLANAQAFSAANRDLVQEMKNREQAEDALRQAQKLETIGQLTGGIAHDFNNLLTVIIGNLEALRRQIDKAEPDPRPLRQCVERALHGSERAATLTRRLLAFARREPLQPKSVDANRLIANMSDLLRRTLGEEIVIETILAGGLWRMHVDPNQLEGALLNLAVNARDAMPAGGRLALETANVHLDSRHVATQSELTPGEYVVIAVSDAGVGMARDVIERAFEPFFTTKEPGDGTGLGLSQVYGFVKQSGGHIDIQSTVNRGTTVKIYLPRLQRDIPEADERAAEPIEPLRSPERAGKALVVEDDRDVLAHSTMLLSELGYSVIGAADGPTALAILQRHPDIELLFTDIGLPGGMNGRQLATVARGIRPTLKVLYTTGYARDAIVHNGRLDEGIDLITKPYTYSNLAAKLRDVLERDTEAPCVLVVEDDALVRLVAVDSLAELGFDTLEAASAAEAVEMMRRHEGGIAALLIDVGLPDRPGDMLAAELRRRYASLPLVLISGYRDEASRLISKGDRYVDFLGKPYDTEQLRAAFERLGVRCD